MSAPYSNADFAGHLDWIVETTIKVLEEGDQDVYAPMIFVISEGQPHMGLLADFPSTPEERQETLRGYGAQWRERAGTTPEAVFLAAEVWMARYDKDAGDERRPSERPDSWEAIYVMGLAADGRANGAEIEIKRTANKTIRPGETITSHYQEGSGRVEGSELLKRFFDGCGTA